MINKLLKKLGYIHKDNITEEELCVLYATKLGDPSEHTFNATDNKRMFEDLSAVEGFTDYLRTTCAKDMQRYFGAEDDSQRNTIRGAFSRTMYERGMIAGRKESKETKLPGSRYDKGMISK